MLPALRRLFTRVPAPSSHVSAAGNAATDGAGPAVGPTVGAGGVASTPVALGALVSGALGVGADGSALGEAFGECAAGEDGGLGVPHAAAQSIATTNGWRQDMGASVHRLELGRVELEQEQVAATVLDERAGSDLQITLEVSGHDDRRLGRRGDAASFA